MHKYQFSFRVLQISPAPMNNLFECGEKHQLEISRDDQVENGFAKEFFVDADWTS